MVNTSLIAKHKMSVPLIAASILIVIAGMGIFAIGFDQGQMFSLVFGQESFDAMYLHELTHDMRHAAGFPCH
ncbi:MAG TPA: CbtB domain-containing protein [Nitrosopumilaceae archaeon]|nr:CbtB domain-containing protein [Nitrosopumilaceae archaeon]